MSVGHVWQFLLKWSQTTYFEIWHRFRLYMDLLIKISKYYLFVFRQKIALYEIKWSSLKSFVLQFNGNLNLILQPRSKAQAFYICFIQRSTSLLPIIARGLEFRTVALWRCAKQRFTTVDQSAHQSGWVLWKIIHPLAEVPRHCQTSVDDKHCLWMWKPHWFTFPYKLLWYFQDFACGAFSHYNKMDPVWFM